MSPVTHTTNQRSLTAAVLVVVVARIGSGPFDVTTGGVETTPVVTRGAAVVRLVVVVAVSVVGVGTDSAEHAAKEDDEGDYATHNSGTIRAARTPSVPVQVERRHSKLGKRPDRPAPQPFHLCRDGAEPKRPADQWL